VALPFEISVDVKSGVPFYRQIIDQVKSAIATGTLSSGDRLPTVRQLAVNLSVNPNTVSRAYTELELTGLVETHMGTGTFVGQKKVEQNEIERRRMLDQICQEFLSRASSHGFTLDDILDNLAQRKER
jgi:GntR family transcriptional regulator